MRFPPVCLAVTLLLLVSCSGRSILPSDGATARDAPAGLADARGDVRSDGRSVPDLPTPAPDALVNRSLYIGLFVEALFADCMPMVPPDPVQLKGHLELLNQGDIPVGPIQLTAGRILALSGAGLHTFSVEPITATVIKPGEGLSPSVKKVPGSLQPAGACGLCGDQVRVALDYAGAALPAGARVVSEAVSLGCAY